MLLKNTVRKLFNKLGYDVSSFHHVHHSASRRMRLFQVHNVDVILDVGANVGQYGHHLRNDGYKGKIVSFEPLSDAFAILKDECEKDHMWICANIALGSDDGSTVINVAGNSASSSILDMLPEHEESAPGSAYIRTEDIKINRLDTVFDDFCSDIDNIYMKVDAQGYGKEVLRGAEQSLDKIKGIQMEVSLVPLYENEPLIEDMIRYLREKGFVPMSIETGFGDKDTGQLLQADIIFYRV